MSRHLPFFSRLLALVLALTVLAPGFGWEVVGYAGAETLHAVDAMPPEHSGHDHAANFDEHLAHAAASAAECGAPEECAAQHHHCCPGHMLGHLPVYLSAALRLPLANLAQVPSPEYGARFSSRVPQGLERPPKFFAA